MCNDKLKKLNYFGPLSKAVTFNEIFIKNNKNSLTSIYATENKIKNEKSQQ